ncbi:MAG: 30S ribosomal protein S20 [Chloroflexi bacterium]|nr:30S ribosomal protein S20 [Chloroflexota bacterium]
MPVTKSAERAMRVSERKQLRNKPIRSRAKTEITRVETLIAEGKLDDARQAVTGAISALDKAATKDVLHRNNAARRKARLMKKLNQAVATASQKAAEPKAKPAKAKKSVAKKTTKK